MKNADVSLFSLRQDFDFGLVDKPTYIRMMYELLHSSLFDYSRFLNKTNIKKIEIVDDGVIMHTRDRGLKFRCAIGDYRSAPIEAINFFDYEKDESYLINEIVLDGDVIFDIGANIGWYSVNLASTKKKSMVFSFEPIPQTYNLLADNISLNELPNVMVFDFGFSNVRDELTFYFYPEGSGNASYKNVSERKDIKTVLCNVRTLDDFDSEYNQRIDFIKCDVEGAEFFVFQGAENTLKKYKPIVFSELLRKWAAKFSYHPNEVFSFMRGLGYEVFSVSDGKLKRFTEMTDDTVETNFFFLHIEKHQSVILEHAMK